MRVLLIHETALVGRNDVLVFPDCLLHVHADGLDLVLALAERLEESAVLCRQLGRIATVLPCWFYVAALIHVSVQG